MLHFYVFPRGLQFQSKAIVLGAEILEHDKERIIQFFNPSRFPLAVVLQERVVNVQHFKLEEATFSIHLRHNCIKDAVSK